jgi:hypothetical protein
MGYTSYSTETRSLRAAKAGYLDRSTPKEVIFKQQAERKSHASMDPKGVALRECRDSTAHPNPVPMLVTLDVTGSMHDIPRNMVAHGLPTMMSTLIQDGVPDASLCFIAVGDHEVDGYPLQIGQFESGDEELDMWLTRTYLEGGGGGNAGESYHLAWFFAHHIVKTDAWDKRGQKGFLFTIGDEPVLPNLPKSSIAEIFGQDVADQTMAQIGCYDTTELLRLASERWEVFHIHVTHGGHRPAHTLDGWKQLLGDRAINVDDYTTIPKVIADTTLNVLRLRGDQTGQGYDAVLNSGDENESLEDLIPVLEPAGPTKDDGKKDPVEMM